MSSVDRGLFCAAIPFDFFLEVKFDVDTQKSREKIKGAFHRSEDLLHFGCQSKKWHQLFISDS